MKSSPTFLLCTILLLLAFGVDMITPQALVAAILLTVPIAMSSLLFNRKITAGFVIAALGADAGAGWYNGLRAGYHWNAIAIGNRSLAAFSIVLVAVLGAMAQKAATNAGNAAEQRRQVARAQALRRAMEVIRSSLNLDSVARATVREANSAFSASGARLYTVQANTLGAAIYRYDPQLDEVVVEHGPPEGELLRLIGHVLQERRVVFLDRSQGCDNSILDVLCARRAVVAPLASEQLTFGVLVLSLEAAEPPQADTARWVAIFAEQAALAAAQASLFVELGNKNAALLAANETLEQRGEVIRDLVYALSHDLRTPLAAAAMTMQQALDDMYGPLPDAYREILRRSVAANDELRRLAETLLMVARYESGDQSSAREPVRLENIAQSVINELEPLWRSKDLTCLLESGAPAIVLGDESELRRAIMNLVANAVHWTPEGGSILVASSTSAGKAIVRISDTGYGISEQQRAHLFERLAASKPHQGSGSGLGLYIVRRIAESHGGAVRYEPHAQHEPRVQHAPRVLHEPRVRRGSTFILELPLAAGDLKGWPEKARVTGPDTYVQRRSG